MDKIDALNIFWSIINIAENANTILQNECAGNSNRFEWCKSNNISIKKAEEAYNILKKL